MADKKKHEVVFQYKNDDITVFWRPALCHHSGKCARGLPAVFKPQKRPWIIMAAADTEEIKSQVDKCPSGALAWEENELPPAVE